MLPVDGDNARFIRLFKLSALLGKGTLTALDVAKLLFHFPHGGLQLPLKRLTSRDLGLGLIVPMRCILLCIRCGTTLFGSFGCRPLTLLLFGRSLFLAGLTR